MGRRKSPVPIRRGRVSLSFNMADPMQQYVYNYLVKNRGKASKIVVDAILAGQTPDDKKTTEAAPYAQTSVVDTKPAVKIQPASNIEIKQVERSSEPKTVEPAVYYQEPEDEEISGDFLADALDAFGDA